MSAIKIVITGPESTGKSTLAMELAHYFKGGLITEYARQYVEGIDRPYNFNDLEIIAKKQIQDLKEYESMAQRNIVFIDTYLIITKVWFEVVYKKTPDWLRKELINSHIDLFLLCAPDLPWIKDNIRENGGEMREWLYKEYEKNLIENNFSYNKVDGFGNSRLNCAVKHIEFFLAAKGRTFNKI